MKFSSGLLYKDQSSVTNSLKFKQKIFLPVFFWRWSYKFSSWQTFNPFFRYTIKSCSRSLVGFISNFPPVCYAHLQWSWVPCEALPAQAPCMQRIDQSMAYPFLSSCVLNQWRSISIDLTRTSPKMDMFLDMFWNRGTSHDFCNLDMLFFMVENILCQVINSWPISALGFINEGI